MQSSLNPLSPATMNVDSVLIARDDGDTNAGDQTGGAMAQGEKVLADKVRRSYRQKAGGAEMAASRDEHERTRGHMERLFREAECLTERRKAMMLAVEADMKAMGIVLSRLIALKKYL